MARRLLVPVWAVKLPRRVMLYFLHGFLGLAILAFVAVDVVWTTLLLAGGGPLTSRLSSAMWKGMLRRHHASVQYQLPSAAGLLIVFATILVWFLLVWLGWTLVFCASEPAVVETASGRPADFWGRAYFAGFTLVTLGLGDYRPVGPLWQIATVVAAANGFFFLTLSITYLLPLIGAVVQKRHLAAYITTLGRTPEEILLQSWNGSGFGKLPDHLITLAPRLMELGQNHLAYPVLHFFHSLERETAAAPSVAVLDEALTLLHFGVAPEARPDQVSIEPLRRSITKFVTTLSPFSTEDDPEAPPPPTLDRLRAHGIPMIEEEAFQREMEVLADRRRMLLAMVRSEGWSWEAVAGTIPLEERELHQGSG